MFIQQKNRTSYYHALIQYNLPVNRNLDHAKGTEKKHPKGEFKTDTACPGINKNNACLP